MSTVIHPLQQGHTYSNRAIPPDRPTPRAKHMQTITKYMVALNSYVIEIALDTLGGLNRFGPHRLQCVNA